MIRLRRFGMLAATLVILAQTAACSRPATGRELADEAWSTRLTQQAERLQQQQASDEARLERAHDAWSQRLQAQLVSHQAEQARAERARQAWSDRLTGLAGSSPGLAGMSDRAAAAWTERLTRLAERSTASQ